MDLYRGKKILLVEDDPIITMLETRILENSGFVVDTANTGESAIEIANSSSDIDLILMDIDLGKGIDGTVAAERILKTKHIPLIFLSSHTEKEIVTKTEGITSYGYIVKNSQESVMLASIRMAFKLYESRLKEQEQEKILIAREQYLSQILKTTRDGFLVLGRTGKILDTNEAFSKISGFSITELLKFKLNEIEAFPVDSKLGETLDRVIETGSEQFEIKLKRKDSTIIDTEVSISFMDLDFGQFVCFFRDTTTRKQIEEKLILQESRLSQAQNLANLGSWELNHQTGVLFWSNEIYRIFGMDRDSFDASYEAFLNTIHPEDRAMVRIAFDTSLVSGNQYEINHRIVLQDGTQKLVQEKCEHFYDEEGRPLRSIGTVLDITRIVSDPDF